MTTKRELAAQVMLQHRLNNLLRISDTVELDTSYITCAEYQLFIDDKLKQGEYRQPDHWKDTRFPKGDARRPIAGVRFSDAEEFCSWLSTYDNSRLGFRYRLPTTIEAEHYSIDANKEPMAGKVGTWCQNNPPIVMSLDKRPQLNSDFIAKVFDHTYVRTRDYIIDLDHVFTSALPVSFANESAQFAKAIAFVHDRALDSALTLARDVTSYSVFNIGINLNRTIKLASDRAPDVAISLIHSKNLDSTVDIDHVLYLAHSFDLDRAFFMNRDRARALDLDQALNRSINLATSGHRVYELDRALDRARKRADLDRAYNRFFARDQTSIHLLDNLDREEPRNFWISYALSSWAMVFAYFSVFYDRGRDKKTLGVAWNNLWRIFTSLGILEERIAGRLPAWEGIRIVRERTA